MLVHAFTNGLGNLGAFGVTDAFRMYLRPLLGLGMPDAFRLRHNPVEKVLRPGRILYLVVRGVNAGCMGIQPGKQSV